MRNCVRLSLLLIASAAVLGAQAPAAKSPKMTAKLTPEAVHRSALVIDTHADTPQRFVDENYDLASPLNGGNFNLESVKKGNLGAEFFSIWVEPNLYKGQYAKRTLVLIDAVKQQVAKHPDKMMFVATPEGIELAHRRAQAGGADGDRGRALDRGFAGAAAPVLCAGRALHDSDLVELEWLGGQLGRHRRYLDSAHQGRPERIRKDVVYEMNRLGMMVDISHVSDRTFFRTLVITRAPVIASHSSARALCDAPRNMTDDMLRAVAHSGGPDSKGGVVQVNFYSAFLSQAYRDAQKAQKPEVDKAVQELKDKAKADGKEVTYEEISKVQRQFADRIPRPPLSALIDHIDHIAKVAGVDHVGLGSDFDGVEGQLPEGIDSVAICPRSQRR